MQKRAIHLQIIHTVYMKHTLLSIALSLQAGIAAMAATNDVASPDGRLVVTVGDEGGRIFDAVKNVG